MNPSSPSNTAGVYASNATARTIAAHLATARSIAVLTHTKPDGDAVGSTLAMARTLRALGKAVTLAYAGPLPFWLPALAGDMPYTHISGGSAVNLPEVDAIVICDTGSWAQLEEVAEWLSPRRDHACIIDHHRSGDADVAPRRLIDIHAASTCEPMAEVCTILLTFDSPAKLPLELASPLYVGLATDTGWFRHSNLRPGTLRLAAALLEAGVDHPAIYALIEQSDRPARIRLMARALASLELHAGEQVAVLTLMRKDFHDTRADPGDSGGFADMVLAIATVKVAAVFTEAFSPEGQGPITKVSFRSKEGPGAVDVNSIAGRFGGGGHIRAAGARIRGDLHTIRAAVITALAGAV